jgi:cell fate regulator YaaT (PSP1 superfamily)
MPKVVGVRFHGAGKAYHFEPGDFDLRQGDAVIVETVQGVELGIVADDIMEIAESQLVAPLKPVMRVATDEDIAHYEENCRKEAEAFRTATDKITSRGLDMHLVNVEYTFDNRKIIFYFTADGRVDFRELVKDLAAIFRIRIELRQIGVRDEARMIGGVGICGRELCCCSFLNDFVPVSIKMAKEQSLSMNPAKISGICGRLMCCLKYEQDAYEDAHARMPRQGHQVSTPDGDGYVIAINLLKETVTVRLERGGENDEQTYKNEEVEIIGGKPGKRCPPGGCGNHQSQNNSQNNKNRGRATSAPSLDVNGEKGSDEINWPRIDSEGQLMTDEEIAEEDLKRLEDPDRCDLAVAEPAQNEEDMEKAAAGTPRSSQNKKRTGRRRGRSGNRQNQRPAPSQDAAAGIKQTEGDNRPQGSGSRSSSRRPRNNRRRPGQDKSLPRHDSSDKINGA